MSIPEVARRHRFAIIGGTNRAGTTSLYQYLGSHPDVCLSALKETRFFLDEDYPLPVKYRFGDAPLERYLEFFSKPAARVWVEASPDYLYSPGTPKRVKDCLGQVKWIFVLREPIDRLISWFHYGKQMGVLRGETSFEEFVALQLAPAKPCYDQAIFRTLDQGRYSEYLRSYYELFGAENVLLLSFGILQQRPLAFMEAVCQFIGIDSAPYQEFDFAPVNVSYAYKRQGVHRWYSALMHGGASQRLYFYVSNKPAIRRVLHFLRAGLIEPAYLRLNLDDKEKATVPTGLRRRLEHYYAGELNKLEALSGTRLVWNDAGL